MRRISKSNRGKNRRKAALVNRRKEKTQLQIWAEKEIELACKSEKENAAKDGHPEDAGYGCACHKSALKAFVSLCEDGHSGYSIGFTRNILNRLIDGKPLKPIEDTEDVWNDISDWGMAEGEKANYQCKRMSSLFKYVYKDGTVKYKDVDRYYCYDINNENNTYTSSLVSRILDEMYPITMPYMPPNKQIRVCCEDFLTDKKNGDFDTVGIYDAILPDGEKVYINRWFKESENGWEEINNAEYQARKAAKING